MTLILEIIQFVHMLKINGEITEKYVIDLDKSDQTEYIIDVESATKKGVKTNWFVDTMRSNYITVTYNGSNSFTLTVDLWEIIDELTFYVRNTIGEEVPIVLLPTSHSPHVKEYTFKSTKPRITRDTFSFTLKSLEDDVDTPWYVDYSGQPVSYEITPEGSSGGCKVKVSCRSVIFGVCDATIILKQSPSELCLRFNIHHNNDKIESVDVIEGCWLGVN